MSLQRLQVSDFRCLESADLNLDPRFTLLIGANASGKTSLLEAVYFLGRGRSFRTRRREELIRSGAPRFVVSGDIRLTERRVGMGVMGTVDAVVGQIGGSRVGSLGELAAMLPVQIIDPDVHGLVEEGPARRRQFLDWGVFHVEHGYLRVWQNYQRVLKQRNAALRTRQPLASVSAWDHDLVRLAASIDQSRARYVESLLPVARHFAERLLQLDLCVGYRSGWSKDVTFWDALRGSATRDQEAGVTHVGPHRADLTLQLSGMPVRGRVSRGQQKLLATALLIAQTQLIPPNAPAPTLLLDDPAAELDEHRLGLLIDVVRDLSVQLIVTSLADQGIGLGIPGVAYRVTAGHVQAQA